MAQHAATSAKAATNQLEQQLQDLSARLAQESTQAQRSSKELTELQNQNAEHGRKQQVRNDLFKAAALSKFMVSAVGLHNAFDGNGISVLNGYTLLVPIFYIVNCEQQAVLAKLQSVEHELRASQDEGLKLR